MSNKVRVLTNQRMASYGVNVRVVLLPLSPFQIAIYYYFTQKPCMGVLALGVFVDAVLLLWTELRSYNESQREIVEARVSNWVRRDGARWALLDMHLRIDSRWTLRGKVVAYCVSYFVK